jgi:hypothetical protein
MAGNCRYALRAAVAHLLTGKRPSNLVVLFVLGLIPICSDPRMVKRAGAGEPAPAAKWLDAITGTAPEAREEQVPERIDPRAPGARDVLRDAVNVRGVRAIPSDEPLTAARAIDGDESTAWRGAEDASSWIWRASFRRPVHVSVLRAAFGASTTKGVPIVYRWEARLPRVGDRPCDEDTAFVDVAGAEQRGPASTTNPAEPTHKSWFVDVDACALKLVVDRTNGGPPIVREVAAFEGARDVLRDGTATSDDTLGGFPPAFAIDGTYEHRWVGAPDRDHWTLTVTLPQAMPIDRVRLVLGSDATGHPRGGAAVGIGRTYGIAFGPSHYVIEGSEDGAHFTPIAATPTRADGSVVPLRRRLVRIDRPRALRAIRLVIDGATGASGVPQSGASPVVREIAAYRADDRRAVIAAPWILSVNSNPAIAMHMQRGAEIANDIYYAKFLQQRFAPFLHPLRRDDRYARSLGMKGELLEAAPGETDGEALESIEGDDEQLERALLTESNPPPITVLSGSNDWDYASRTEPDVTSGRKRWHWDPLPDARHGGMGRIHRVVKDRAVPFLGFCGGAQILALLQAKRSDSDDDRDDAEIIDSVLRRTTGQPIRGYAPSWALSRSWPGEARDRAVIRFDPTDRLFWDIAGPTKMRASSAEFLESHVDVVRPDAFLPGGPLEDFVLVARSEFCGQEVVDGSPRDRARRDPRAWRFCATVPEVFRANSGPWPLIGVQSHAEHPRDFLVAAQGEPAEAPSDPRMFLAAAFEEIVDAYLRNAR